MAHSSLQVCMDSSDWLHQGTMTMSEELSTGLDSSSSPSGGGTTTDCMLAAACSSRAGPPLMERRLRPPHDQHLKCPRCDSTHTKFCYYNNYSLSQPRYFCKTCRRYWTKGGTLRNIPVGGGCRKNKKPSPKKSNNTSSSSGACNGGDPQNHHINHQSPIMMPNHLGSPLTTSNNHNNNHPIDLHLSFPHEVQFPPHLAHLIGSQMSLGGVIGGGGGGGSFMGLEGGGLIRPIDFMESKYEGFMGEGGIQVCRGHDFMGNNGNANNNSNNNGNDQFGLMGGIDGGYNNGSIGDINYSSNSLFGVDTNTTTSHDIHHHHDGMMSSSSGISFMDQRLLLPYDVNNDPHHHNHDHHHHQSGVVDVKPNPKLLSLEWQDQGCTTTTTTPTTNVISDHHNAGSNALNSWTGFLGSFQSPTTNSLV